MPERYRYDSDKVRVVPNTEANFNLPQQAILVLENSELGTKINFIDPFTSETLMCYPPDDEHLNLNNPEIRLTRHITLLQSLTHSHPDWKISTGVAEIIDPFGYYQDITLDIIDANSG